MIGGPRVDHLAVGPGSPPGASGKQLLAWRARAAPFSRHRRRARSDHRCATIQTCFATCSAYACGAPKAKAGITPALCYTRVS